jgi:hypothetical protein
VNDPCAINNAALSAVPPAAALDEQEDGQWKQHVELRLDADNPRMNKNGEYVGLGMFRHQGEIVGEPRHEQLVFIFERRQRIEHSPIDQYRGAVGRHDAEEAPD